MGSYINSNDAFTPGFQPIFDPRAIRAAHTGRDLKMLDKVLPRDSYLTDTLRKFLSITKGFESEAQTAVPGVLALEPSKSNPGCARVRVLFNAMQQDLAPLINGVNIGVYTAAEKVTAIRRAQLENLLFAIRTPCKCHVRGALSTKPVLHSFETRLYSAFPNLTYTFLPEGKVPTMLWICPLGDQQFCTPQDELPLTQRHVELVCAPGFDQSRPNTLQIIFNALKQRREEAFRELLMNHARTHGLGSAT